MKAELARRETLTDRVEAYFRERPYVWIPAADLARVGGFCAWRSRVADVRARVSSPEAQREGTAGSLDWNGNVRQSAYMFKPQAPLGRDAGTGTAQRALF